MLCGMAIRMKEWGMLRAPSPSVQIPVQGVMGWGEVAQSLGGGISAAILGSTELAKEKEQVTATGELAAFSRQLHEIADDVRTRLFGHEAQDWEYAWEQLSAPRFSEAVAQLPPNARRAGRQLAEDFSRRAALQAFRDREMQQLDKARDNWQQRVESAVQAGDATMAERWLQSGAGVFLPQEQLEQERRSVRSRAGASLWMRGLEESPMKMLAELAGASEDSLPQEKEDMRRLQSAVQRSRKVARAELVQRMEAQLAAGEDYDEAELELAGRAELLSERQLADARRSPRSLTQNELCVWNRRVDEAPADSPERESLQLDILTAPIPLSQRRKLLKRFALCGSVPEEDRLSLSRGLWQMYSNGQFGCPGDVMALQRLEQLQSVGLPLLAESGTEAAANWMEQVNSGGIHWVCFSEK